jgi:hypothetical protein
MQDTVGTAVRSAFGGMVVVGVQGAVSCRCRCLAGIVAAAQQEKMAVRRMMVVMMYLLVAAAGQTMVMRLPNPNQEEVV